MQSICFSTQIASVFQICVQFHSTEMYFARQLASKMHVFGTTKIVNTTWFEYGSEIAESTLVH